MLRIRVGQTPDDLQILDDSGEDLVKKMPIKKLTIVVEPNQLPKAIIEVYVDSIEVDVGMITKIDSKNG